MPGLLESKVVLVTGAAAGLGRATADVLAQEGAALVLADRDTEGIGDLAVQLNARGSRAIAVTADVSVADDAAKMVREAVAEFGRLDGAYNNAGVEDSLQPMHLTSEEDWDRVLNVDLKGTWLSMKYELEQMVAQQAGSIVNAASVLAHVANPNVPAYTSAKHGVAGLTRSAAIDYAQLGIRVNAVSPGAIRTELLQRTIDSGKVSEETYAALHPMNRLGEPIEVAHAVTWLLSDRSSFVTGHCLAVDGGMLAS
jgi:NAD(P)-dependent dehydrogenase (short-subunit alcohol dehydrogenase family)